MQRQIDSACAYILVLHRESGSSVCVCVRARLFALPLHPAHISFIGCVALLSQGPGRPPGQQVPPLSVTVLEGTKAQE